MRKGMGHTGFHPDILISESLVRISRQTMSVLTRVKSERPTRVKSERPNRQTLVLLFRQAVNYILTKS